VSSVSWFKPSLHIRPVFVSSNSIPHALYRKLRILYSISYMLYALYPTPYTLSFIPYTLYPTPYTLKSKLHTIIPNPVHYTQTVNSRIQPLCSKP